MFFGFDACAERGLVVIGKHGGCSLRNHGSRVHAFVNKVDRATGQGRARSQNISVRMGAGKVRKKRGMNVSCERIT